MTEQELLQLKKKVDKAKTTVAELNGQKTASLNQLKTEFGCKSVEELETVRDKKIKQKEKIDIQIEKGIMELEEKLNSEE